jgi:hypothetical protein
MLDRFFGQFLLLRGAISQTQLDEGLEYQRRINRRIGEIATAKGILSPQEVALVLEKQRNWDLPFGEIAERLSLITPKQRRTLVVEQGRSSIHLGEALLVLGHLSTEQYARLLPAYGENEVLSRRAIDRFLEDKPVARIVLATLMDAFQRCSGQPMKIESTGPGQGPDQEGISFSVDGPGITFEFVIPKDRMNHLLMPIMDDCSGFFRMLSAYLAARLNALGFGGCTCRQLTELTEAARGRNGGFHAVLISPTSRFHAFFEQSGDRA